jgi:hypothetical protein
MSDIASYGRQGQIDAPGFDETLQKAETGQVPGHSSQRNGFKPGIYVFQQNLQFCTEKSELH